MGFERRPRRVWQTRGTHYSGVERDLGADGVVAEEEREERRVARHRFGQHLHPLVSDLGWTKLD